MKVNRVDARQFNAKQITVEIQPPQVTVNHEWLTGALKPTEFDTDVTMGHLKLCVYFKGKDRNAIVRSMSEFMANFTSACDLELDGYKGTYRGFMTASDCEKTITKKRYKINLEFDGFFYDDEISHTFDAVTSGMFNTLGSRKTPCILEVYARSTLTNYEIGGLASEKVVIETLSAGQTLVIDGKRGLVTISGTNAFDKVNLWEFPALAAGETVLTFSNTRARVVVKYNPMWI